MNKTNTVRIAASKARDFIRAILERLGAPRSQAQRWAKLLVETSLLGLDSHGLRMLERYIAHIEGGGIHLKHEPKVVNEAHACATLDAQGGVGHLAADTATHLAVEKAKGHGITMVNVRNGNHVGACGLYARQCALLDCIGLCTTVSRGGIAPWGGKKALLGVNPIAIAAPIADSPPFLFDASTSQVAMGRITAAADRGEQIPNTWALNVDGKPTNDPISAIAGSLLPIGTYKGYGLTMAWEMLASLLSGGALGHETQSWIQQTAEPTGACFSVTAINIGSFLKAADFKQRMKDWVQLLTHSERRKNIDRIYYPGQIEAETYLARSQQGIPLCCDEIAMLTRLSGRFGIKGPL